MGHVLLRRDYWHYDQISTNLGQFEDFLPPHRNWAGSICEILRHLRAFKMIRPLRWSWEIESSSLLPKEKNNKVPTQELFLWWVITFLYRTLPRFGWWALLRSLICAVTIEKKKQQKKHFITSFNIPFNHSDSLKSVKYKSKVVACKVATDSTSFRALLLLGLWITLPAPALHPPGSWNTPSSPCQVTDASSWWNLQRDVSNT